jgi:Ca2+-binding RTX toxin-like protein
LLVNGEFSYEPPENFTGQDSFEYTITDGLLEGTATATLNIDGASGTLTGDAGDNVLIGGSGDNVIDGLGGADLLLGGGGNDMLQYYADARWPGGWGAHNAGSVGVEGTGEIKSIKNYARSHDVFDGGEGTDTLLLTDGKDALFLDDSFSPANAAAPDGPRLANIEIIDAGAGDDVVDLTSNNYDYGDVTIFGGAGKDTLWASSGDDTLDGGEGKDNLFGGAGNDILDGGAGKDTLTGYSGNDTIMGGEGNDVIYGGWRGEVEGFVETVTENEHDFSTDVSFPELIERREVDALDSYGIAQGDLSVEYATTATVTFLETGAGYNNTLGFYNIREDGTIQHTEVAFENVKDYSPGTEYTVSLPGAPDTDFGFFVIANGDRTNKGYKNLDMEPENIDFIYKWGTADERLAKITDQAEDIALIYDDGHTVKEISGHIYHTTMRGGDTNLNGDDAVHVVSGVTDGDDTLRIGFEDLRNLGDADFNDVVFDLQVADLVTEQLLVEDNDLLYGGEGNDLIYGGYGDDVLIGSAGRDTLYGEAGADIFVLDTLDGGPDTIKDFNAAEGDSLNITDILSGYDESADDLTDFARLLDTSGGDTQLQINADGTSGGFINAAIIEGGTGDLTMADLVDMGALIADQSIIV